MFFIENLRNEYTDKASFVRFSYVVNVKTIFFSRKLCDFKIMQMAFCLQAVESAKRNCWQKKKKGIFYAWMIMQESRALKAPQQVLDMRKLFPS